MKTLDMLNRKEIRREYRLSLAFIKQHDALLGGIGKPRIYDRARVEQVLREMVEARADEQRKAPRVPADPAALRRRLARESEFTLPALGVPGRIIGRGGKEGQHEHRI